MDRAGAPLLPFGEHPPAMSESVEQHRAAGPALKPLGHRGQFAAGPIQQDLLQTRHRNEEHGGTDDGFLVQPRTLAKTSMIDRGVVTIDDKRVVNQERKDHKFTTRIEMDLSKPLGVATWETATALKDVKIELLEKAE